MARNSAIFCPANLMPFRWARSPVVEFSHDGSDPVLSFNLLGASPFLEKVSDDCRVLLSRSSEMSKRFLAPRCLGLETLALLVPLRGRLFLWGVSLLCWRPYHVKPSPWRSPCPSARSRS